jgi:hypothetical protein
MPLLNPRFADAGAQPGEAANWTLTAFTSLQMLAAFGGAAREDFERWTRFLGALADVTTVRAFFGNYGFEQFERAWANSAFLFELPTGRVVACTFDGRALETWTLPTPFMREWAAVASVAGLVEDFVRPGFIRDWSGVSVAALPLETFSGAWTRAVTL